MSMSANSILTRRRRPGNAESHRDDGCAHGSDRSGSRTDGAGPRSTRRRHPSDTGAGRQDGTPLATSSESTVGSSRSTVSAAGQQWRTRSQRHASAPSLGDRLTRDGPSTARVRVGTSVVLNRLPGRGGTVNASSRYVLTPPSESLRCRPNRELPVMRRLRDESATTLRDRAVSDMGPGESAVMIIPVQVRARQWLLPSGGHPRERQSSTPAPTD
jgi:hypothetical protein